MTGEKSKFLSLTAAQGGSVAFGNGKSGTIVDIGKIGPRIRLVTCVTSCNSGCYFVTFQARLVDCVEILQVVGRGFLPRLGSRFST